MEKKLNHEAEILDDDKLEQASGGRNDKICQRSASVNTVKDSFAAMSFKAKNGDNPISLMSLDADGKMTDLK